MDFSGVLNTVLTVTTIIGVALAGLQRGVVQNLREANSDLRARNGDLEKERDEAEAENKNLRSDLAALGRVVTNEAGITALGMRLDEHHAEAKGYWQASTELGQKILDELRSPSGGTP